jgi:hypothetical protein
MPGRWKTPSDASSSSAWPERQPDEFGEIGLHVYIGTDQTWCHTQAPSVEAVCKSRLALGVDLDPKDVAEVQVLP